MNRNTTATLQTIWDCKWSQHGYRLTGVRDALQPEPRWVCVREGGRRPVTEQECAACPWWMADEIHECP